MFLIIVFIGIVITVVVWQNVGPVWGLVAGFLFVGGLGWSILLGLTGLLLPGRKDKQEFIAAWEARSGEMRFGRSSSYPPGGAYKRWVRDREQTRESAHAWMDRPMEVGPGGPTWGYQGQATVERGGVRVTVFPWQGPEFADLRQELRSVKAPGGGLSWQVVTQGDIGFHESTAFVLNKQMGWDQVLGRRYLSDLADGRTFKDSVQSATAFLMAEGRNTLMRLRGEDATESDAQELAEAGAALAWQLTGGMGKEASDGTIREAYKDAGEIARLALEDRVTPKRVREIPPEYLPEQIAGFGAPRGGVQPVESV